MVEEKAYTEAQKTITPTLASNALHGYCSANNCGIEIKTKSGTTNVVSLTRSALLPLSIPAD